MPPKPIAADLPSLFGQLASQLSDSDLRLTSYEIFIAACRTSTGKPLSFIPNNNSSDLPTHSSSPSHNSLVLQRSLTSAAASKMKKALSLKSPGSSSKKSLGSGPSFGQGKSKKALTVGELMRTQMGVSETIDSRVRRALLRISAG